MAQTELYSNGDVEIRYGNSSETIPFSFAAGIQDVTQSVYESVTLQGCPVLDGLCLANQDFPKNQGLRFSCKIMIMNST